VAHFHFALLFAYLKGPKGDGDLGTKERRYASSKARDMQVAKRTGGIQI